MKRKPTEADILLWEQLKENFGECAGREYKFCAARKWRLDFCVFASPHVGAIGIEIEGAAFTQGRHTRGSGFVKDMEKYNHAALLGWRVLRFTPKQVLDGSAIAFIRKVLCAG